MSPIETRCDGCRQHRPLFLYEPDCGMHLGANAFSCPWCSIEKQPLLCAQCWSARKEREDNDPHILEEIKTWEQICAANRRADERSQALKATCDGIAAATERDSAA